MAQIYFRRIMGVETEYGISARTGQARPIGVDELGRVMFDPVRQIYGSTNVFRTNSSRLYLDVGSHPEIATGECDDLIQLLHHVRAGDEVVNQLALQAEATLSERSGTPINIIQLKNNVDSAGNSYGCHENYLISRDLVLKETANRLLPFLITRQLLCGAGCISHDSASGQSRYLISQRAHHVWESVSSATTRTRPMINTRDEPHADSQLYRRMHVIVGDSNMSDSSFLLKVGTTILVLEMIEAGFFVPPWDLADAAASIREISHDWTGRSEIALKDGTTISALEVQRQTLTHAQRWLEQRPDEGTSNALLQEVTKLWNKVVTALENRDWMSLSGDVDWAIKLKLLKGVQTRLNLPRDDYSHPKLKQVDFAYHDIRQGRGLFLLLEGKNQVKRWSSDKDIAAAVKAAPSSTRAKVRGDFLSAARALNVDPSSYTVDWTRIKLSKDEHPHVVDLKDPFCVTHEGVEKLIKLLK